jgi:hypothetical protein
MNATTRYILTATAVGAGLLTVGATANAIAGGGNPSPASIGDPVVVPSSAPAADTSTGLEQVNLPGADDLTSSPTPAAVLDTGGWATSPGSPSGGGDDGPEHEGVEIEGGDD